MARGAILADTDHGVPLPCESSQHPHDGVRSSRQREPFFLGSSGALPQQGGFNPYNGYYYMFHSHNEKEIVNNNVFPGA